MAKISNNPFANALDQRIRKIVEETVEAAVRTNLREIFAEELAQALGTGAPQVAAPAAKRPGRKPGPKAAAKTAKAAAPGRKPAGKKCEVVGCNRPYRSQGYCAAHYQAARKYDWPLPAPENFKAPPRPSRGRPPKDASKAAM
ncbi:hypothetical protein [Vulgatibacter incomptus]|uniref:Vegetative protein n=1 Tax=Vulgatibacter incomptus TaxID=1391653 RepID=A0A0K1P8N7_9BACT|nr:hypothetical protein [Vulgatibacter incomptus]AKU89771.1 hypothetical protein AKJ08_0158 [Vulgatibacter incomptus]